MQIPDGAVHRGGAATAPNLGLMVALGLAIAVFFRFRFDHDEGEGNLDPGVGALQVHLRRVQGVDLGAGVHRQPVAARRVEAENAMARIAAGGKIFPDTHGGDRAVELGGRHRRVAALDHRARDLPVARAVARVRLAERVLAEAGAQVERHAEAVERAAHVGLQIPRAVVLEPRRRL